MCGSIPLPHHTSCRMWVNKVWHWNSEKDIIAITHYHCMCVLRLSKRKQGMHWTISISCSVSRSTHVLQLSPWRLCNWNLLHFHRSIIASNWRESFWRASTINRLRTSATNVLERQRTASSHFETSRMVIEYRILNGVFSVAPSESIKTYLCTTISWLSSEINSKEVHPSHFKPYYENSRYLRVDLRFQSILYFDVNWQLTWTLSIKFSLS